MLSLEVSKKIFSIFLANSVSTEGSSSSTRENSSFTWPDISQLILMGGVVGSFGSLVLLSLERYLFLFRNNSPTEVESSLLTLEPASVRILRREPMSLLVWGNLCPY